MLDTGINPFHCIFQQTPKKIAFQKNFVLLENDNECIACPEFDQESNSHGTAVASIIAGENIIAPEEVKKKFKFPFEGPFAVGVASKASLVICRVARSNLEDIQSANAALRWIVDHNNLILNTPEGETLHSLKARHNIDGCELDHEDKNNKIPIVNMSFKFEERNLDMAALILKLEKQKVVCVAGCGNDGRNRDFGYPARYENVLSVGAADCNGDACSFSSQDPSDIDVYALGKDVLVAKTSIEHMKEVIKLPKGHQPHKGNHYKLFETETGTSYAAPAVSGLIAILLQQARDRERELNIDLDQARKHKFAEYITDFTLLKKLFYRHFFGEKRKSKNLQQAAVGTFLETHILQIETVIYPLLAEIRQSNGMQHCTLAIYSSYNIVF